MCLNLIVLPRALRGFQKGDEEDGGWETVREL